MLQVQGCKNRLERVRRLMEEKKCDSLLIVDTRNVYYLEGILLPKGHPVVLWIDLADRPLLVTDSKSTPAQAEVIEFDTYSPRRVVDHPWLDALTRLAGRWNGKSVRHMAVEKDAVNAIVLDSVKCAFPDSCIDDVSDSLADLRRSRDPDEVELLQRIARVAEAGFARAREVVRVGLSELDVYLEICAAMEREAGGPLEIHGDFSTGPRSLTQGGAPTERLLELGDLCVFDLFPIGWGYQADLCRTIAVGAPSPLQLRGYELVRSAMSLAEELLQPGRPAREVYRAVKEFLDNDALSAGSFWHHLGHGVGMGGHENPRLIPESDHILRAGDVVSVEPGIYSPKLQGGLRLENTYRLTAQGPVQLNSHPLHLAPSWSS
jgi:Xaa-Pro aminopeptidase